MSYRKGQGPTGRTINRLPMPLGERLWRHIMPEPMSGCWLWTGSRNWAGYGTFRVKDRGTFQGAYRVVYEHYRGLIPDGLQIDHLCRNKACVNPAHLEAVTARVNQLRSNSVTGRNARKTVCGRGHELTQRTRRGSRVCRVCERILARERSRLKRVPRACEGCARQFTPQRYATQRFCTKQCKNARWWKEVPHETREAYKAKASSRSVNG